MDIPVVRWVAGDENPAVEAFFRRPATAAEAEAVAREGLAAVAEGGDAAVARLTEKYNGVSLRAEEFAVGKEERMAAVREADPEFKRALTEAAGRIARFARSGMKKDWQIATPKGGVLGEVFTPLQRVGIYVPGGTAPLVSSVLMTVVPAKVAGVQEIAVCTPCGKDGKVNGNLLCALEMAGATEVYRIGGIQAIAAMAHGTETIAKVQKIVGPGGPYVAAAKKLAYGLVDLDMVAGPSEIAILADDTAVPVHAAADLLSQLEHGSGQEKALLVTTNAGLAQKVLEEIERLMAVSGRADYIRRAVANGGALVVVTDTLDTGMELVNRFAPEHFEIMTREPRLWMQKARNAGAVFVGGWTPESAGDFVAGPSHVLPTGGTAACFSGLTADTFRKRTSVVAFTRADLQEALPVIEAMGTMEGLDGHARAARVRFDTSELPPPRG